MIDWLLIFTKNSQTTVKIGWDQMTAGKLIGLIMALPLLVPAAGAAEGKVTWMTTHWPPLMELEKGSGKITGGQYGNQLKLIQKNLPGYDHATQEMRWKRFWYLVEKGEEICNCMAYKTSAREAIAEFSIPISITLPNHIVIRKETFEQLGAPESLSLVDMMQDGRFKGVLIESRSYSHDIDKMLDKYEKGSNFTRTVIDEQTYIKMLARKRMDYILEYPFVVKDTVARSFPELKGMFAYVPITEIAPFYYVYIACPKNEWGKTIIKTVNTVLSRLRRTEAFRKELMQIYGQEQLKRVNVFYDRDLLQLSD